MGFRFYTSVFFPLSKYQKPTEALRNIQEQPVLGKLWRAITKIITDIHLERDILH
jgi:hypothetical protein